MEILTSLQNPRVKQVVKLRDDRRQRKEQSLTIVEGQYELELALSSSIKPVDVYYCQDLAGNIPEKFTHLRNIPVTRAVFQKMSQRENPDGWMAVVPIPHRTLESLALSPKALLILAESIEKPGNLGAILRTSDAVGVDGLLVCDPRVELFNPNVVRASRGTLFSVPAVETRAEDAFIWLKKHGILLLAATPKAKISYTNVDLRQPVCLLVGTEDEGLSDFWMDQADLQVMIPMNGKVNSLNVSTSTAVILYEIIRQRSQTQKVSSKKSVHELKE